MKREEYILIKVTTEEKKIITEKAKKEGLPVSSYIRYEILKRR